MKKLLPLIFLAACSVSTAQDTIRVCTYNLLNFSQSNEDGRTARFERILREIQPDILVTQEMVDQTGQDSMASAYGRAINNNGMGTMSYLFHDGPDSDNSIFMNLATVTDGVFPQYHPTSLRDIAHYILYRTSTTNPNITLDTIHIFSVHLKAGDTQADEAQRLAEVQTLRSHFPQSPNAKVIVVGDFNFYSSNEPGYQLLTGSGPRMLDPLHSWEHSNVNYVDVYTQSPRMVANAGCGGGTGGGMDDRFDFIFYSESLQSNYIVGSHTIVGNDGQDRRNAPINNPPNTKVSTTMADDLFCASDHLPVYADFVFDQPTGIDVPGSTHEITFTETYEYINVYLPSSGQVTVTNLVGQTVSTLRGDGGSQFLRKADCTPGVYFIHVTAKADAGNISDWYKFVVTE